MSKKIIFTLIICGLALILMPAFVSAADTNTGVLINPIGGNVSSPAGTTDISTIIGTIIKTVLGVVGSIALLMFIYGGFLWLTSGGSTEKIKKGKDVLTWAIIGLVIIFLAYTLVGFVITALTGGSAPATK